MALASAIIADLRPIINDSVATYRWSDATLVLRFNQAKHKLYADHPEAFYSSTVLVAEPSDYTATTDTVSLTNAFEKAFIHLVAHLIYLEDSDDAANQQLADMHLKLYMLEVS